MSQSEAREIVWLLMLIPFGVVLGIGAFFIYCAWRRARVWVGEESNDTVSTAYRGLTFEQPSRWLAVKAGNPLTVQSALELSHPTSCSWEEGLAEAHEDKLFISPPLKGWILVFGSGLPEPSDDPDRCYHFLAALSRKLGHVQFFSVSRVVHYHCWAMLEKGQVYRAYAWGGETLWNQGSMTAAEKELEMFCLEYASEQNAFAMRDSLSANTEKINQLASRWSIDPGSISPEMGRGRGIVGALSHSKHH